MTDSGNSQRFLVIDGGAISTYLHLISSRALLGLFDEIKADQVDPCLE